MLVKDLIQELSLYPENAEVYVYTGQVHNAMPGVEPASGIEPLNYDENDELLIHV